MRILAFEEKIEHAIDGSCEASAQQDRAKGMLDGFDQLGCGGVLLDALGSVVCLNLTARGYMGAGIVVSHGQFLSEHRSANAALQRLIRSVLQPRPPREAPALEAVTLPRPGMRPLIVHAAPILWSTRGASQCAKAILMLTDPDKHREPAESTLRQAFGLTSAEIQLALGLARGQDLQEIAAARGVSIATIRFQLKALFAKTETHRQAELVALLVRVAAIPRGACLANPLRRVMTPECFQGAAVQSHSISRPLR